MPDVTRLPTPSPVLDLGPASAGRQVIVDGRAIPKMRAIERGNEFEIILDGRFGYLVPADLSKLFATAMAQAMAIGAGYPNLAAESREAPFAPEIARIDLAPERET